MKYIAVTSNIGHQLGKMLHRQMCSRTCHKKFFLMNKPGATPRQYKIMVTYGKYWPVAYLSNTVVVEGSGSGGCGLNRSFSHLRGSGSHRRHTHHGYRLH